MASYEELLAEFGGNNEDVSLESQAPLFSTDWDSVITETAQNYPNVPEQLVRSLIQRESSGDPYAEIDTETKWGKARGLGQFIDETAKRYIPDWKDPSDSYDPVKNIRGIYAYLDDLVKETGSLEKALIKYHGGGTDILGTKSEDYAKQILSKVKGDVSFKPKSSSYEDLLTEFGGATEQVTEQPTEQVVSRGNVNNQNIFEKILAGVKVGAKRAASDIATAIGTNIEGSVSPFAGAKFHKDIMNRGKEIEKFFTDAINNKMHQEDIEWYYNNLSKDDIDAYDYYQKHKVREEEAKKRASGYYKYAENIDKTISDTDKNVVDEATQRINSVKNVTDRLKRGDIIGLASDIAISGAGQASNMLLSLMPLGNVAREQGSLASELRKEGIDDPQLIQKYSVIYAIPSGAVEQFTDRLLLKPITEAIKSAGANKQLTKQVSKKLTVKLLTKEIVKFLGGAASEGLEEVIQGDIENATKIAALMEYAESLISSKDKEKAQLIINRITDLSKRSWGDRADEFVGGWLTGIGMSGSIKIGGKTVETLTKKKKSDPTTEQQPQQELQAVDEQGNPVNTMTEPAQQLIDERGEVDESPYIESFDMTEEDLLSRYEYDKEGRNLLKSAVTTDPKIDEETRTRLLSEMDSIDNTTEEVIDEEESQETETLLNEQEPTVEPQSSQEATTPISTTETSPNADLPSVETATEQPQPQEVIPATSDVPLSTTTATEGTVQTPPVPANEVEQETPASTPIASTTDLQSRGDEIASKFDNVKFIKPITDESGTPKLQFEYTHKGKNGETLKKSIITILAESDEKALQRKIDNEKLAFKSIKSASTSEGMRAAREKRMAAYGDKRSDWIIKRGQLINNIVNEGTVELTDDYLLPKNQGGIAERKEDGTIVFQNETLRKSLKIEEIDGKQYISINRSKKYDPTQKLINMAEGVKVKGGFREEIESENVQEDQSYDVNDIAAVEEKADLDVIEFANEQRKKLKDLYVGREDSKEYQDKLKIIDRYVEENLPEGAYVPKATDRALIAEKSPFAKEVEKGVDGLTLTSTSEEYITKGKQLAGKIDGVRFDGIQEGLVGDGKEILPAQLQFTDQKTKTTFYLPLNSKVTDLQNKLFGKQIEFLKPELKKVFTKLDKLPTIEFTPMAAKYNAVISNDKGETIIRLNSKIQRSEIIPSIEHELFGHFGATKVFELDKELYNYAYQLFQREVNADSDIIKQIKKSYKKSNEEVLFDEWVAFNIEEASKRYFDKDGKFNEQRFKNDETVLNKVIRVIKKLTEKILDKLFNYKPTKKELDNLFIAIIQEFPKITSGEYTGGKRYSVAKEQTTTTETKPKTKRKPPKRYTQEEKEQLYVRDKLRLKNGSGNVKIRFYDFINKYLYGAGADSYRRQIFELIEEIKDNNDPLINKAIELIDEAIEFRKVSKEFTKLKAFTRRKSVKSNLKEENSDMIDINKRIAEIYKKYQQFVDYQTLKRLKDRGGEVIKPKVVADTVRRLRGGDKYVVVNKETNKITTSERFDTKEAAREWINKNSERVSSNIGEKYESVINQGFVRPISKTDKKRAQKLGLPENTEFDFYQIIKTDNVKERISELKRKLTDSNGKMFDAERIRIEVTKIKEDYRDLVSKKEVIKVTKDATLEKAVDDIGVQLKAKKRTDKQAKSALMWGYKESSKSNWLKPFGLVGVNFRYKMQEMDDYDNKGGEFQKYILKPMDENGQKVHEYENKLDDGLKNDLQIYDLSYKEMMAMSDQITVGIVERAFSGDKKKRTRKVKFDNGEIEMSEAREVSLYLISKSERGYKHLTAGGIFIETDKLKKTPFKFTENDILNLEKRLNSRQKKLAKVIISHFKRQAEIGNEISTSDIGEKIFTESNYFPFLVDTDYIDQNKTLARTPEDIRKKFFKGLPSITKERQNSDAPIILEDPFIAVARTRQLFNKYMDMVLVTNKTWAIINNKTFRENMISNGFGAEYHAIRDDLMDMMTVKPFDSSEDFLKVISSIFTVSVLGYKPTVVLSQPIATVLYFPEMDIGFKEFGIASLNFKNWFEKASIKEIWNLKEHIENLSPYLKKRFNSSMEIIIRGKQTRATAADMFFGGKQFFRGSNFGEKLGSLAKFALSSKGAMSWIQDMDTVGIMGIWKCCEVEAITKGYKRGTSEFNEYVARRTEHITRMTQQTFDSLDSPPLARTALGRLTTRFLSQTLKNTMMLRKQFFLMNKHGIASKEGFKAGCNSLGIILSQSLAVELLKVGIKAVGGGFDDDEWMTWQYWAKSLSMNVLTLFNMPGIVLSGIVGGYGNVGGGNFGALTERIGDSVRKLKSAISNQDGEAATIAVYELAKTFLPIGGPEQLYKFAVGLVEIWGVGR